MNVIVLILKALLTIFIILLKILLVIILVILVIILIFLLTPFKYKVNLNTNNLHDKEKSILVDGVITWFFKAVKVEVNYKENQQSNYIYIFGKSVESWGKFFSKFKRKKKHKKEMENNIEFEKILKMDINLKYDKDIIYRGLNYNKIMTKTIHVKEEAKSNKQKAIKNKNHISKNDNKEKNKSKKTKEKTEKTTFKEKWNEFKEILQDLKRYNAYVKKYNLIKKIFIALKNIVMKILPDTIDLDGEIGLEDVALTGQILGGIWIFNGMFNKNLNVRGNFEKEIIKIDLFIKGKFKIGSILWPIIKYIFSFRVISLLVKILIDNMKKKKAKQVTINNLT